MDTRYGCLSAVVEKVERERELNPLISRTYVIHGSWQVFMGIILSHFNDLPTEAGRYFIRAAPMCCYSLHD